MSNARQRIVKELGISSENMDINAIRHAVVSREFEINIGKKALTLLAQYPFLVIGEIKEVTGDYVFIKAEVTNISELDGSLFRIHTDDIEVFFIETRGYKIPELKKFGKGD
ncbi:MULTISPECIES: hypothetical protein [Bacillus]|uniref:hypothetical protein n=1 Tax=Bacillus TaxID=1386 RepID=UPI0002E7BA5F|nr:MULTISPECIES: hypothetical protein [Bacillus]